MERQIFLPEPKVAPCAHASINRFMVGESAARSNHADKMMLLQADLHSNAAKYESVVL